MDKNMLEFWGRAFLNAARSQQQLEDMNKLIGLNIGANNPSWQSFLKAFGWPKQEKMDTEDMADLTPTISDAYKVFVKAYLTLFDVISKEEYIELVKENGDLKTKIAELEKVIQSYKNLSGNINFDQEQVVDNLTEIMKNQTQQFQDLMKQLNQPYKKTTTKKKEKME
jgi:hypothetical protein